MKQFQIRTYYNKNLAEGILKRLYKLGYAWNDNSQPKSLRLDAGSYQVGANGGNGITYDRYLSHHLGGDTITIDELFSMHSEGVNDQSLADK